MNTLENHNYFGIHATIIADSIHKGNRLTTFIVTFPRIVLAEFNTHRMFSRNSASSRAIPFETMVQRIKDHPFIPIKWMKDHKGMQGAEYFDDVMSKNLEGEWLRARNSAVDMANNLSMEGLTKQIVNRLLEPFLWHTAIVTSEEWDNFFALRAHEAAEIHIQQLAFDMLHQYNLSIPNQLVPGEWHIPFGDNMDRERVVSALGNMGNIGIEPEDIEKAKTKIAVARCARVSYLNFNGKDDYEADIKLYDRLSGMGHWSPFEHCAMAPDGHTAGQIMYQSGNFNNFIQLRKSFIAENKNDGRIVEK